MLLRKLSFILLFLLSTSNLVAQVGIGTNTPDNSAMLEVSATDKGLLPPRVALTSIISASPVTSPATGLLVFNTATAGTAPNNVVPGYYYWSGSAWIKLTIPADNAANVSGTVAVANGGTGATTAAGARTNLGATTVGSNLFTLSNPSAITFPRLNADNTVSTLTDAEFRTAIGVGTGSGTVTSVGLSLPNILSVSGSPVTSSGTLSASLSNQNANLVFAGPASGSAATPTFRTLVAADIPTLNQNTTGTASNVTGTVAVANGGTGSTTAAGARTNLGATTVGSNLFILSNPSAITFPRFNADNTVTALSASEFRTAIGVGTGFGTVTSVATGNGITGGTITTSGTLGLTGQALAFHNLSSNGLVARTGSGTVSARTITGTTNQITVSNGDGVSGNPTLSLPQNIHTTATPTFGSATFNGTVGMRASAASSTPTQILVVTSDPSSTTRTIETRTPAQLRADIGAGTGNGTVTSVGLTTGTSGTDVNVSGSPVTGSGTITLNIPDASTTARGLVTRDAQTFAGAKTFSAAPVFSTATASQALFTDGSKNVVSNSITGTGSVVMSNSATLSNPKINTSASSASAAGAGALRYNSSNLEYSNGSSWRPLATVEVDNTYKLASTGTARGINAQQDISIGSFVTLNNSTITVVVPSGFSDTRIILQWNVWGEVKANASATGSIRYQILQTTPTSSTIGSVMMTGWSIASGNVTRFSAPVGYIIENAVAGTYTFQLQMNREGESGNAPFGYLNWGVAGTGQVFVR